MAKSKRSRKANVHTSRVPVAQQAPATARQSATGRPAAAAKAPAKVQTRATRPATTPVAEKASRATPVDFSSEYRYVVSDLKRLGVVATSMFAVMAVLTLVIG